MSQQGEDTVMATTNDTNNEQSLFRSYITQYFTQLTRGCKESLKSHSLYCIHNPLCNKPEEDANLSAVKAIEYAKTFKEKFLCSYLKDKESLIFRKNEESILVYLKRCQQKQAYTFIIVSIKEHFSLPSQVEEIANNNPIRQANDTFDYFKGLNLKDTREIFDIIMSLNRDDVTKALLDSLSDLSAYLRFNSSSFTTPTSLISFVLLLSNPFINDIDHIRMFENLCIGIYQLIPSLLSVFGEWLSTFSKDHFTQTLTNFQQFISVRLLTSDEKLELNTDKPIIGACAFMQLLDNINIKKKYVDYRDFYNDMVNNNLNLRVDIMNYTADTGFSYTKYPFILNTFVKSTYLQVEYTIQQDLPEYLVFQVRRDNIIHDALNNIQNHKYDMKKELKIKFKGEEGIDQGGVQKEFFQIVVRKIFDPEFGMFIYNERLRTWWFNTNSLDKLEFELIGIILGLALYNSIILDVHFPLVVYKKLLGYPVDIDDVESVEPEIYRSMIKMRDTTDDVSQWSTYFSVTYDNFGETKVHELKPGGDNILVDNSNKEEYLTLYTNYLLNISISKQWVEFYKGFQLVCDSPFLRLLRPQELEDLICGVEDLDFTELEKVVIYEGGYTNQDQTIKYFWETIHGLSNEMKKKFLSFSTGCDRVPYGGLSKMHFSIHKQIDSDRLPSAHTCFNALILPCYPTKEKLEERLIKALNNAEGFGLK
ncbi:hypothetical protein SAMD00019534_066680 [Acytostelium subglobosum LB1]|uniref:hypothetical protein n=1 Tax=Acytostelium subglobosum LB1 TaxID=1410327 RepID=UPI000644B396|nr:hypothetical protein SAMD00019534_066680 [Acytostelium subglobosum LB1]GAM23493.1 hypothetical protein SAMD00019534_066680 [Acytostelium subglobosum LB1]|eukprot:XP_012753234.1 hypothetical protein SAMD00019534_066680 [Acytostelium subglobosum LB1]